MFGLKEEGHGLKT